MLALPVLIAALQSVLSQSAVPLVFNGRARELEVRAPRIDAAVTVDGALSEPPWRQAAVLTGFSRYAPQDGVPASDSTEVLVWYSPTAIHFGIRAFQPREQVRAALADRDKIASDDYVQILLGTFHDGRQATVFMVNPLGVQADGILRESGNLPGGGFSSGATQAREAPDLNPDFVFESKGRITDWGYEVEIRIPFKSLRYQATAVQAWGINIVRKVQYRGYEDSWVPAQRAAASFLAQSGTLAGLTDLHRGLVVDLTPEATQRTEGLPGAAGATDWRYDAKRPLLGATVRWGIANNLTLNGTANPDFSQVEADAGVVTFDPRSAISFPEKRPFFLDGIEQFTTPNSLIYTRRVVQPVAAVKLAGKAFDSDFALLSAVDAASASTSGRDRPLLNMVRLQHDLGGQSRVGLVYTDREDGPNWNRVLDVDSRLVWQKVYSLQAQLATSATERAGLRTNGPLWDVRFNRDGRGFGWKSTLTGIADDFRTESGFISRAGQVRTSVVPRYTWFGRPGAAVEQVSGDVSFSGTFAYRNFTRQGDARDKMLHFDFFSQLRGGWTVGASLLLETFGYDPAFYSGRYRIEVPHQGAQPPDTLPFTGTPRLANRDWVYSMTSPQLRFLQFSALYINGQDENFYEWSSAHLAYWSLAATVRVSEQLRVIATHVVNDYQRHSNGRRVGRQRDPRLRVEYQVTPSIFVRAIGEYFSDYTDMLRDDSRTNFPLLVFDAPGKQWIRTVENTNNKVHGEFLFSYKPVPGTTFYAGYGADLTEPEAFAFRSMPRRNDAFYLKASYLFRL